MEVKERLAVQIRWLISRDHPEVLAIENQCFEWPWNAEDLKTILSQRNCMGMVAEWQEQIVGFMVYRIQKDSIHVLNFAVHPDCQGCDVGSTMVQKLKDKLSQQRRTELVLEVRETNQAAQMFFSRQGFRATQVLRGHYEDTEEDAYQFKYTIAQCENYPPSI